MSKNFRIYAATLLGTTLALGLGFAHATQPGQPHVLRGGVEVLDEAGRWTAQNDVPVGKWVRSTSADTTITLSGSTVRLKQGTSVLLNLSANNRVDFKAKGGGLFVKVQPEAQCDIHTPASDMVASAGEYAVDAQSSDNLQILAGSVMATPTAPPKPDLKALDKTLALDGPDVRRRGRNRKRFTQGEENKGKRIGEDAPPTTSASPPMTETPAYTPTPTFTPTLTPTPSPTAPPQNPPPTATGGSPWPWLVPTLAAVGTGTYFLVRDTGNEPNQAVFPISP